MIWLLVAACVAGSVPAALRWLRVAQREHYLAPAATRFAWRWWGSSRLNRLLATAMVFGLIGSIWSVWFGFLVPIAQIGPRGLSLKGRTSALAWTSRMRRAALATGSIIVILYLVGALVGSTLIVVAGLAALPVVIDGVLLALAPLERSLGNPWVEKAAARLQASGAEVVAITGSFGKTSTKAYTAHLLGGARRVVASPASFNNRMGLARAINEQLVAGTEVFIAEMGTYRSGEIADLCRWIHPKVAAIVAVGPVHLERFKTEPRIVAAKSEILDQAEIGVIAIDHPLLAELARARSDNLELITAGTDRGEAQVVVRDGGLYLAGDRVAEVGEGVLGVNLAVAVGICLALGLPLESIVPRLADMPDVEHRQTVRIGDGGFTIIDDTYNSNPAGAAAALDKLSQMQVGGRRVVVTPGMVELGPRQRTENMLLASRASREADHLIIVGDTNRVALLEGAEKGVAAITVVGSREEAVDWVRENLGPGDIVLYENDLPDHYP